MLKNAISLATPLRQRIQVALFPSTDTHTHTVGAETANKHTEAELQAS